MGRRLSPLGRLPSLRNPVNHLNQVSLVNRSQVNRARWTNPGQWARLAHLINRENPSETSVTRERTAAPVALVPTRRPPVHLLAEKPYFRRGTRPGPSFFMLDRV